jgi:multidrug resistance protein MdtO
LKTTIAVMVVYFIYTMLDWPGMRTSIVTCFFVALGSLGETVHKLVLRISGALIGGSHRRTVHCVCVAAYDGYRAVMPVDRDRIGGAGWVATSSELLSYAGLQIAFAFFLGILQGYAPATDLTVLRDRIAGIMLGNIVMTVVFTVLWPESAISRLQAAVQAAREAISAVLKRSGDPGGARAKDRPGAGSGTSLQPRASLRAQHVAESIHRAAAAGLPRRGGGAIRRRGICCNV